MPMANPVFLWNQLLSVGAAVTVEHAERPSPIGTAATYHIHSSVNNDMHAKGTRISSTAMVSKAESFSLPLDRILPHTGMPRAMKIIESVT